MSEVDYDPNAILSLTNKLIIKKKYQKDFQTITLSVKKRTI